MLSLEELLVLPVLIPSRMQKDLNPSQRWRSRHSLSWKMTTIQISKSWKIELEECGYDFELTSKELINYTLSTKKSRTINVSVDKMFCNHCPEVITDYLNSFGDAVVIQDPITLKRPFIKFTYVPNLEKISTWDGSYSIWTIFILQTMNLATKLCLKKKVRLTALIEQVSVDEHLRKLTRKETRRIIVRLILATVTAIPTLIFGVIAMPFGQNQSLFRKWIEEPIWAAMSRELCGFY